MSHTPLCLTWIKNNLNTLVSGKIRTWLDLPPCATAHFMSLSPKLLGLDVILPSMLYEKNQVSTLTTLSKSADPRMATVLAHYAFSTSINLTVSRNQVMKSLENNTTQTHLAKLYSLQVQSLIFQALTAVVPSKELESWHKHISVQSPAIANFARKALLRCLATQVNMLR